ncbi:porphobilinogen synthase [Alkalibacter saccharofermentans]|uniref:Delta-aminolevulinic acid dehydratase n=1 Tax=Alkalibacter saccharofermentans DSM 14828 TaxID=1120975 RepID=A0A1M4SHV2_9FIRM|nr:porphobilinogen synthase [Alkalibacter saccharofermentans]SHE31766.1 porphobilinogen synthase [Alkalibacter saccharofermentans DSM 14828]
MNISKRPRRLRGNDILRKMTRETHLKKEDFVYPLFVQEGNGIKTEIKSMPGQFRYSIDSLVEECSELIEIGIDKIMLFGIPADKDDKGSQASSMDGIIQKAVRILKKVYRDKIYIITDVCLCEYTSHGHCGIIDDKGRVRNDETVDILSEIALTHAKAGADMIAPSDMMDGRIGQIRTNLDLAGYQDIPIMAYSAKYASSFYGPFRDAADSAPAFGDRKAYQMDPGNIREAVKEVELDIHEGADIVMVKPALSYLDVVSKIKQETNIPVAAYNVSGEYAMLKMAVENGIMSLDVINETLLSIKRAGADIIITYFAKEFALKSK